MQCKLMKYCKGIHQMAKSNCVSWMYSTRTISLVCFVAAFCGVNVHNHLQSMNALGYKPSFGESLFILISNGFSITTMSTLFLLMVNEIPIRVGFQYKLLIRSSRTQWVLSQILYCFWMVLSMLLLTVVCASLFLLPSTAFEESAQRSTIIPTYIQEQFSPFSACLFAILPMFFFWLTMVFIILFFSLCRLPQVGQMVYMVMLVSNVMIMVEPIGTALMPIYYSTLQNITDNAVGLEIETMLKVLRFYLLLNTVLIICMVLRVQRTDLSFHIAK